MQAVVVLGPLIIKIVLKKINRTKEILDDGIVMKSQLDDVYVTQSLLFFRNPFTNVKDSVLIEYHVYDRIKIKSVLM